MLPDHAKPWVLYTDASGFGCRAAVLCQDHGSGPQPVLFVSHKLSGAELNWPVHDKEMYAIVYMFKTCRWYVQDRHVHRVHRSPGVAVLRVAADTGRRDRLGGSST